MGSKHIISLPVDNKDAIIERIRSVRQRLESLGVKNIGLFGSFAKGHQVPASDVDVLVEFMPEHHTFDNFMEVSFLLEEILGRRVEVVTPESLSPHIGPHILRELVRIDVAA
jgi:uncharacterized protein